jgi:hypothetical protein
VVLHVPVWLIAKDDNTSLAKACLIVGVAQPLVMLLSSSSALVLQAASSAIQCLLSADTDGLAVEAFHSADVKEILAHHIQNSSGSITPSVQSVINAIEESHHKLGPEDHASMELFWTSRTENKEPK